MIAYHGTAKKSFSLSFGTYLTKHKNIAEWYANNSADAFGGNPVVHSVYLEGKGLLLDNDKIEWIGYEQSELEMLRSQGYDFLHNESYSEIITLKALDTIR